MGVEVRPYRCDGEKLSRVKREEAKIIEDSCKKSGNWWIVPYPWKRDPLMLPNNKEQATRRLEAMEKQLSKNPEHAKAYNSQMKEMEDLKFSRKITQEEERQYTGPVHYITQPCSR